MKKYLSVLLLLIIALLFCGSAKAFNADSAGSKVKYDVSEITTMNEGDEISVKQGTKYVGNKTLGYGDIVEFGYKNTDTSKQHRMAFGIGSYGFYLYYNPDNPVMIMSCDIDNWARKNNIITVPRNLFVDYNEIELVLTEKDSENVRLEMTYSDGEERKVVGVDFAKVAESDMLFRYGDMNFDGNRIKSLANAPVFGNGFLYSGENVSGENVYGGCNISVVSKKNAEAAGVPEGFESDSVLIASNTTSSFDMSFDFTPLAHKRKHITKISFTLYVEKNAADNDGYPEIRIPDGNGGWILRYPVGSAKTGQWLTITVSDSTVLDKLCTNEILGKFVFGMRANGVAKMFIDSIAIETLPPDVQPPVICAAVRSFKTTEGTYPTLDYITITDDSGAFDVKYEWSDGSLDFNGRLNAGNHTCKITAVDGWDNETVVVITYEVEAETPVERYSIIFRREGKEDVAVEYSAETEDFVVPPELEVKRFYNASWEDYEFKYVVGQVVNAVYTPIDYTVNYYADGEKVASKSYTISDSEYADPAVPEKDGYTAKWEEFEFANEAEITVNAIYTPIDYTVTFAVGETIVAKVSYNYDDKNIEEPAVLEKRFYTGKWGDYTLKGNVTVQAVYSPKIYTVTYKADGKVVATIEYSIENFDFNEPKVPEKKGYEGKWEEHEFAFEDITVNAVYTKIDEPITPPSGDSSSSESTDNESNGGENPSSGTSSDESSKNNSSGGSGCLSSIAPIISLSALLILSAAIIVLKRKKA